MESTHSFRERIGQEICNALEPRPDVLAAWEGGSAAFGAVDAYSDLDMNVLVSSSASVAELQAVVEAAMEGVSPITLTHEEPPGRYYQLRDGGEFFLVDLCFFPREDAEQYLDSERHGEIRKLFDKGDWLNVIRPAARPWESRRADRLLELEEWYSASQVFVWKAIHRAQPAEAFAAYWAYTLRPLVELLGMVHRPARWDFGMRYLDRDLPKPVYERLRDAMHLPAPAALPAKLRDTSQWGEDLIEELRARTADTQ